MHPRYAAQLTRADLCLADDAMMIGACARRGYDLATGWIQSLRAQLGIDAAHPVNCSFLYEKPITPEGAFFGIFQQDTDHYAGSHWGAPIDAPAAMNGSRAEPVLDGATGPR